MWGGRWPRTGQQALQFAVLEDAIRLLREGPRGQQDAWEETLDWLERPRRRYPFDFEALCAALTMDAQALRSGVLSEIADQLGVRRRPGRLRIGTHPGPRTRCRLIS